MRPLPYVLESATTGCRCHNPECEMSKKGPRMAWLYLEFGIGSEMGVTWWLGLN